MQRDTATTQTAVGSSLGGVSVTSGQDIAVKGSNVLGDQRLTLSAGNNVSIQADQDTQTSSHFYSMSESGLLSGGGFGITIDEREQSSDQCNKSTSAAASAIFNAAALSLFTATCALLVDCESITDIDKPIAPIELMWTKGPGSHVEVDLALRGRKLFLTCSAMDPPKSAHALLGFVWELISRSDKSGHIHPYQWKWVLAPQELVLV